MSSSAQKRFSPLLLLLHQDKAIPQYVFTGNQTPKKIHLHMNQPYDKQNMSVVMPVEASHNNTLYNVFHNDFTVKPTQTTSNTCCMYF